MIGQIDQNFLGYGFSLTGRSHINSEMPCQDNHKIVINNFKWQFLAVADGLGSAPFSQRGSEIAVEEVYKYLKEYLQDCEDTDLLLKKLEESFEKALEKITEIAENEDKNVSDYDSTLTVCIFDGKKIMYGHVGDCGILAMDQSGKYHSITKVQKGDAWNEVTPLRSGKSSWIFECVKNDFCGVLLLSDGLLDHAMPSLLRKQDDHIYRNFVNILLPYEQTLYSEENKLKIINLLKSEKYEQLHDDLTAVAILNKETKLIIEDENYLQEPNWKQLYQERYYKLYPHLKPKEGIKDETKG